MQLSLDGHRPERTWLSHYPFRRIDHVFVSDEIEVVRVEVPRTDLARKASDHLPLIVDLRFTEKPAPEPAPVVLARNELGTQEVDRPH